MIHTCQKGHESIFRGCAICAAAKRKQPRGLKDLRESIAYARSCRVKRGNYRPIKRMAERATDEIIEAMSKRSNSASAWGAE